MIPIPEEQVSSTDIKGRCVAFSESVHDMIGDHKKAIVCREDLNEDYLYYNAFFNRRAEIEGITYPWDKELEEIPLEEQDDTTMKDLDEYIGSKVLLPNREGIGVLCKVKG